MTPPSDPSDKGPIERAAELDLAAETSSTRGLAAPRREPWDPGPDREKARRNVAYALIALLGVAVVLPFGLLATGTATLDGVQDLLGILLPPIVGLVGSAIGFYFGEKS